jgi:hypothetical protein
MEGFLLSHFILARPAKALRLFTVFLSEIKPSERRARKPHYPISLLQEALLLRHTGYPQQAASE